MSNKINSQTDKWSNSSSETDISSLEKFLLNFNKDDKIKTFYHDLYDIIENYYKKGKKVIEVGGQFGGNLFILNQGFDKTLLDLDKIAINKAKDMYKRNNISAKFVVGDMFSMPFNNEEYDIVFNSGVLEHFTLEERKLALKEYSRILKTKGHMILAVPNHNSLLYRFYYLFLKNIGMWKIPEEYKIQNMNYEISENNLELIDTKLVSKGVIYDNYNNLFGLGTLISAFSKIFKYKIEAKKVLNLNKKFGFGNFLKIFDFIFNYDGYLLVFIIRKK